MDYRLFFCQTTKIKIDSNDFIYWLISTFFTNIPPYAILNTSVELAKHKKLNHAAKYINGLLRNVQRSIKFIQEKQHHSTILPCELGAWQFSSPLFPSPDTKFSQYLSIVYSYPEYLVETWQQEFGENMCEQLLQNGNCIAPVYLRDRNSSLPDILHNLNIKYIKYN
ncbi:MAG TPA: transcription antitermination factor NusB, partial [Planctomycetota bacterium]|nr:transcription antitermination factor NusB [Planctomycetota bacterium]